MIISYLPFGGLQKPEIDQQQINDLEQADKNITALRAAVIADAEFALMNDELLSLERLHLPEYQSIKTLFNAWVIGTINRQQLIQKLSYLKNQLLRKRYLYEEPVKT